jgi:RNA polymerase sigma-70 factor, ECF subfamily
MTKLLAGVTGWWGRGQAPAELACPPDELALVERLRQGEREAIALVYQRHHVALGRFARRMTGDELAAEDLVHDVFVQLPQLARRFRGDSQLGTFLIGVAASLSKRHVRASMRRRRALQKLAHEPPVTGQLPTSRPERAALYAALDALPLAQRTAFVLCEVEERSAKEVASALGVPEATVRTRCFHARKKLRAMLDGPDSVGRGES